MAEERGGEFQIGLAMSGAISAGAYTAGVFDFLIQALDEWERARNGPNASMLPNHRVGIKVMSGASAGAITAAIGAVALADANQEPARFDPLQPVPADPKEGGKILEGIKCYLPKLYEAWVEKPGLVAEGDEQHDFLETSDLDGPPDPADDFSRTSLIKANEENPQPVASFLNTRLLDEIAKGGISVKQTVQGDERRAYIAETLHVYMTLSNLRGVPYSVPFDSSQDPNTSENRYHMISHGDRVHYAVKGLGRWASDNARSAFADNDQKREIDVALLRPESVPPHPDWKDYAVCALASAAFPVGLSPRLIGATLGRDDTPDEYKNRRLPIEAFYGGLTIPPAWLPNVRGEDPFWFTTADGGIIDNDPFEYARFSLKQIRPPENSQESTAADQMQLEEHLPFALDEVDRAIIMISPFPELKPIAPQGKPATDIIGIFSALMPALIDQARFKPSEIVLAADPGHGSRYLIGPSRVTSDGKEQRLGIASGLLGGFGGFAARSFREHDYQLGRRNCQMFLKSTFALPEHNPLIESWGGFDKEQFQAIQTGPNEPKSYCIIPLFGTAKEEVTLAAWPQISQVRFEAIQTRIAERFDAVAPRLLGQYVSGILWFLLRLAVRPFPSGVGLIRSKVLDYVRAFILADLVRRDMIEGWDLPAGAGLESGDARLVFGELINPSYDLRSKAGLSRATGLSPTAVDAALNLGQSPDATGRDFEIWKSPWVDKNQEALYTLTSRKPKWNKWFLWRYFARPLNRVPGLTRAAAWVSKPAVDEPGLAN